MSTPPTTNTTTTTTATVLMTLPRLPPIDDRAYVLQCRNQSLSWLGAEQSPPPPVVAPRRRRFLVVVAGQSNAAGSSREKVSVPVPPLDARVQQVSQGVAACFGGEPVPYVVGAKGTLQLAQHPLQALGICSPDATGLALQFAARLRADHPDADVVLYVGALGGTGFRPSQGSYVVTWDGAVVGAHLNLYTQLVSGVRALRVAQPDLELAAVLWHQGENDIGYFQYHDQMRRLVANLRRDLSEPTVPFIVGTMAVDFKRAFAGTAMEGAVNFIDQVHKNIGYWTGDARATCADLDAIHGLTADGMGVHFTADGYVRVANAYYERYVALTTAATTAARGLTDSAAPSFDTDVAEFHTCHLLGEPAEYEADPARLARELMAGGSSRARSLPPAIDGDDDDDELTGSSTETLVAAMSRRYGLITSTSNSTAVNSSGQ
jgi:hypothetical protein